MAMPPRIVPVRAHTRVIAIPIPVPVRPRAAQRFAGDAPMRPAVAPDMPGPQMPQRPMTPGMPPPDRLGPMGAPGLRGMVPPGNRMGPMGSSPAPRQTAGRTVPPPARMDVSEGGGPPVVGGPPARPRQGIGSITDYAPQAKMPPMKKRMRGR